MFFRRLACCLSLLSLAFCAAVLAANAGGEPPAPGVPRGTNPKDISTTPVFGAPRDKPNAKVITYRLKPPHCCPHEVMHVDDVTDVADWGHALIGIPDAWKTSEGKGVKIAVLDTGVDRGHRDLKGRLLEAQDFTGSASGAADVHGHGTHCAGIAVAERNGVGMVGVAPGAQLLAGKVLTDNGGGLNSWIAAGIDWAVERGADVISLSIGGPEPDDLTQEAIQRAVAKGVIVICAAGNEGPGENTVGYPGAYPESVAVAAVGPDGRVAGFSSRGQAVFVSAPGVNVRSCYPGDRFATMSGTSMACPYVAGCAALYVSWAKSKGIAPSADDFKKRLAQSAVDVPPVGKDTSSGFGIVKPVGLFDLPTAPEPTPGADVIEWRAPGIEWNGRKVKRIVIELEPLPKGK